MLEIIQISLECLQSALYSQSLSHLSDFWREHLELDEGHGYDFDYLLRFCLTYEKWVSRESQSPCTSTIHPHHIIKETLTYPC